MFKVGDEVRVLNHSKYKSKHGKVGTVTKVLLNKPYPYEVMFDMFDTDWLFREDELTLKGQK